MMFWSWWSYMFTFYNGKQPPEMSQLGKTVFTFFFPSHPWNNSKCRDFLEMNNVFYLDPFGGSLNSRWSHWHFARLFCKNWVSSSKEWPLRTFEDTFGWFYMARIGIFGFEFLPCVELSAVETQLRVGRCCYFLFSVRKNSIITLFILLESKLVFGLIFMCLEWLYISISMLILYPWVIQKI